MLDFPWDRYARLQAELRNNLSVGDRSWGVEAVMNRILAGEFTDFLNADSDIERSIASEQRRERHRAMLRRRHLMPFEACPHPELSLLAHIELRSIREKTTTPNWLLLRAVAEGHNYTDLAAVRHTTSGSLRARVCRLRRDLA